MTEQSAFNKNNINTATIRERGFLEELNLPPAVISFIRKNQKQLKIVGIGAVLLLLAWIFYDNYAEVKRQEATAQLATALQESGVDQRVAALEEVQKKYSLTTVGLWSRLELAHLDFEAGDYAAAVEKYKAVLGKLADDNPLVPLVQYSIAYSYENLNDFDQALTYFRLLTAAPGFAAEGHLGLGRVYESTNEPAKAREVYENYLKSTAAADQDGLDDSIRAQIEERLAKLQEVEGN